jgi:hypothetical protein
LHFHVSPFNGTPLEHGSPVPAPGGGRGFASLYDNRMADKFRDEDTLMTAGLAALEARVGQGLTLLHFSAQPQPFLTQTHTPNPQISPKNLLKPP